MSASSGQVKAMKAVAREPQAQLPGKVAPMALFPREPSQQYPVHCAGAGVGSIMLPGTSA
ncbi:hypothetical protein GCM10007071_00330 [Marinobacter zhanjiangensis]|uniref:Uncharacterized protein n=1 Tax=Marinobacter zhanjiangensis TaxID=578215 RepID=A0ABQ3AN34_9GAMM|nr:hypothetical protein GCM10007071_00330 [Marinobacter zhanjiangensis]